jgi:hypothetical protein
MIGVAGGNDYETASSSGRRNSKKSCYFFFHIPACVYVVEI